MGCPRTRGLWILWTTLNCFLPSNHEIWISQNFTEFLKDLSPWTARTTTVTTLAPFFSEWASNVVRLLLHHPPSTILSCWIAIAEQSMRRWDSLSGISKTFIMFIYTFIRLTISRTQMSSDLCCWKSSKGKHTHPTSCFHDHLAPFWSPVYCLSCSCQGSWASWKISLAKSSGGVMAWSKRLGRENTTKTVYGTCFTQVESIAILPHVTKTADCWLTLYLKRAGDHGDASPWTPVLYFNYTWAYHCAQNVKYTSARCLGSEANQNGNTRISI